MDFNTPELIHEPGVLPARGDKVGYTFNWFYADAEHIAYFNSGANPVRAKRTDHDFPVGARSTSGRAGTRTTGPTRSRRLRAAPAGDRPALPDQLEQQAGARLPRPRTTTPTRRRTARCCSRTALKRAIRGRAQADAAEAIDVDGVGGHDRPARARVLPLALRWWARRAIPRCGGGRRAARVACSAGGQRRDARPATASTSTPTRSGSWTPGGRGWVKAEFRPCSAAARSGAAGDRRLRQRAQQRRPAPRLGLPGRLVRLRVARTCGACSGDKVRGPLLARVLRPRVAEALPRGAAAVARRRAGACPRPSSTAATPCKCPNCAISGASTRSASAPVGGATQPLIHWINRPTFQQANEIQSQVPR